MHTNVGRSQDFLSEISKNMTHLIQHATFSAIKNIRGAPGWFHQLSV